MYAISAVERISTEKIGTRYRRMYDATLFHMGSEKGDKVSTLQPKHLNLILMNDIKL